MNNPFENLEKTFKIETSNIPITGETLVIIPKIEENLILRDSNVIRVQLNKTLVIAQEALGSMLTEQQINPTARNTEAVAKLIDSISKLIGELRTLNTDEKNIEFKNNLEDSNKEIKTINNNLIIGTSEDVISRIVDRIKNNQ